MTAETALIVGASRGLGLGLVREYLARGWRVIGTVRDPARPGELRALQAGGALEIEAVDINHPEQIAALRQRLEGRVIDVLFVNAGVSNGPEERVDAVTDEQFIRVMVTNALSPLRVVTAFENLVPSRGVIAAMTSALGSVARNTTGTWEVYRASKASLNTLMRSFAARHADDPRTLLVVTPGWVRTDMGGPSAPLDLETSIRGVVDTVAARRGTPGLAFVNYQNEVLPW